MIPGGAAPASRLLVLLNELPVGVLALDATGHCEFRLLASWQTSVPRPVLGQVFEDDPVRARRAKSRLPAWFSNLLPEGALRELLKHGISEREFVLLQTLGADLPGAVRVVPAGEADGADTLPGAAALESDEVDAAAGWHFSLAGVQLKFSALRTQRGMTVPVAGLGGDWILKLPDQRYPGVPANEYATMLWARASGITVPECALIDLAAVSGLPASIRPPRGERQAFVIRRFDRPASGRRIHIEDFAQVLDLYPERKYERFNIETIARITLALAGPDDLAELVRRLVFLVASGNGDAHHKNWSLQYPDGLKARLSPAYDLVSTIQYLPDDRMALNFGGSKRWQDVRLDTFRRLARKIGSDETRLVAQTVEAIEAVQRAWLMHAADFGYDAAQRRRLDVHMSEVPLLSTSG
ncbi:type II toxin-antitoxin system HipA family toxin [Sphaerotilus uruguayifluvii]|uniref:type II toxin-antitoxin system HipA family toxin n=1 Tax=Sphaerotilus uruguayifluvii TaxID=2735897 RepID=UPI003369C002